MPTPIVATRFPKDLIERLRQEGQRRGLSWVRVLREAAEGYLAEREGEHGRPQGEPV
jgi:hypothetical protein